MDKRAGLARPLDHLVEAVMGDDGQGIDRIHARARPVGQAQSPAERLLGQDVRSGRPERHDRVEVGDVPAFLQLVDVDHDLRGAVRLHGDQPRHGVVVLLAAQRGVNLDHVALVAPAEEVVGLDHPPQLAGVGGVLRHDQHEGMHQWPAGLPGVQVQLHLHVLMGVDAVLQLDALQLGGGDRGRVEVLARGDGRLLDEAVLHRFGQAVAEDDVAELLRPGAHALGRGGQLQPEYRAQLGDGAHAGLGAVAVRLVHQQHQIRQAGEVLEVALADILVQLPDPPHVAVDLVDVEDVDDCGAAEQVAARTADAAALVPRLAGHQHRRDRRELGDALEHVFRARGREVGHQLFVDGRVRGQDEEVPGPAGQGQVGDERPHEPGLPHAGREREAERRKIPLELGHARVGGLDRRERRGRIGILGQRGSAQHVREDAERLLLRPAKGEPGTDLAQQSIVRHLPAPFASMAENSDGSVLAAAARRPRLGGTASGVAGGAVSSGGGGASAMRRL